MSKDKKIDNFHTSWADIGDTIHVMKNALTKLLKLEQEAREIRKTLGKGIDKIYNSIEKIGEEGEKDE